MPKLVTRGLSHEAFLEAASPRRSADLPREPPQLSPSADDNTPGTTSFLHTLHTTSRPSYLHTAHVPSTLDPSTETQRRTLLDTEPAWLLRFPNTAFGIALGLGGHSNLWKVLSNTPFTSGVGSGMNFFFWTTGIVVWGLVAFIFAAKAYRFPRIVLAEWQHPVRSHFFNIIHIAVLALAMGTPFSVWNNDVLIAVWFICAAVQACLTQTIYARWLFDEERNIGHARPPFLLSTVGWLLLSILALATDLRSVVGLNFAAFTFGAGTILYFLVFVSIFLAMHEVNGEKGSPVLFLLLAPAAIGTVALAGLEGRFGNAACAAFGWCIVIFILLIRLSPHLFSKPVLLGTCK